LSLEHTVSEDGCEVMTPVQSPGTFTTTLEIVKVELMETFT
jgi:hypothetical protein